MIATLSKQHPHHSMLQPHHAFAAAHHRRNPSAPTLSVQPTGTRGLLALAKPKPQAAPKLPPAHAKSPRPHRPSAAIAPASGPLSDPPEPAAAAAVSESAEQPQPPRGRKNKSAATTPSKPARRAASHQALGRRTREQHHQPDPEPTKTPEPKAAQAEQPASTSDAPKPHTPPPQPSAAPKADTSPRKRPVQHQRHNTAPPSPLAVNGSPAVQQQQPSVGQPSGRLARNRRQRLKSTVDEQTPPTLTIDSPAPSTPIPVPAKRARSPAPMSRSAPLEHSTGLAELLPFPIMTDHALSDWDLPAKLEAAAAAAAAQKNDEVDAQHWLLSGPRTAPLGKSPRFPNYSPPPTPTPASRAAKQAAGHARSPSYPTGAMFDMSLDDEPAIIAGTRSADVSPFRLARHRINQPIAVNFPEWSKFKAPSPKDKNAPMWAASAFQTGPTSRDLPAPGL